MVIGVVAQVVAILAEAIRLTLVQVCVNRQCTYVMSTLPRSMQEQGCCCAEERCSTSALLSPPTLRCSCSPIANLPCNQSPVIASFYYKDLHT